MKNLARIFSFAWPHRWQLFASVFFAILVAVMWSLTLLLAFPVMKVLLQGQHLGEFVQQEIESVENDILRSKGVLPDSDKNARSGDDDESPHSGDNSGQRVAQTDSAVSDDVSILDATIADSWRLTGLRWLKTYLVPLIPADQFDTLALILGILLVATLVKGICRFVQETLVASFVELTIMGLRKTCFRRTLALDYQTLALEGTPGLMSRFTHDINLIGDGLTLLGTKVVREPLKAIACVVCAFWVNWQLTLLSLLCIPVAGVIFYRLGRMLKRASQRLMESMSRIYKVMEESFVGMKVVIAFEGGRRHRRRFHQENKEYYSKAMTIAKIEALSSPTMEVLGMLAISLGLLPGAYLVLRETKYFWGIQLTGELMDIAELAIMYTLLAGTIDPVRKLSSIFAKLKRADAATQRVCELLDRESRVKQPALPRKLPRHEKSIEFDSITFRYAARDDFGIARPAALENVTFAADFGDVVAIVGENGSGKSTLLNLIPRFCDPDDGAVRIDGIDLREVRLRDLRQQIGIVTQETVLFDETIFENVRYGNAAAGRDEVEAAARKADVLQLIEQLPDGFDTRVGEKGQALSGGQRQRLALARAILRDPSILILDEATSAIDAQSEFLIHQVLKTFVRGRTTFLITHTLTAALLEIITKIVVMDRGSVVAVGTHDELLENCRVYQRLFRKQFKQQKAA